MRIINVGYIVVFMLMLIVPLVFVDLSGDRISEQENRMLADRPPLSVIKNHPATYVREFDEWFKDSTGFREQLITVYNVVDKNRWLNRVVQYTEGWYIYLIGERGHHYFADVDGRLIPKFQGKQFLSDEQLQNMAVKLEEVKTYLDSKGIPLVVMLCADKETIYPEFYPKSIKRGPEPVQLDVITKYLQTHTSVDVFNIRQALLNEKDNYLLYEKNMSTGDSLTHYNQIGAFFAYRELMKHIIPYFHQIFSYGLDDVDISYNENGLPRVILKTELTYKQLDPSFFDDVELVRPFTWENVVYENVESNFPVVLFLRDSYVSEQYIGKYFAQQFGKAVFIHYQNIENLEKYINQYKPDIVVFETAERQLDWFANCVAGIPELP